MASPYNPIGLEEYSVSGYDNMNIVAINCTIKTFIIVDRSLSIVPIPVLVPLLWFGPVLLTPVEPNQSTYEHDFK